MLIEFITKIGGKKSKLKAHFGDGSSNTENYNNNNFYSYLQKNDLSYTYYINQTPKGASNMQRIAELLRNIKKLVLTSRVILAVIK